MINCDRALRGRLVEGDASFAHLISMRAAYDGSAASAANIFDLNWRTVILYMDSQRLVLDVDIESPVLNVNANRTLINHLYGHRLSAPDVLPNQDRYC